MWMWWLVTALAAEPIFLDAGPAGSPVLEGFTLLSPGVPGPGTYVEPPLQMEDHGDPDPLTADHNAGGTIALPLPPGTWDLYVQLGAADEDPQAFAGGPFGLRVAGQDDLVVDLPPNWPAFAASPLYAANPVPVFRVQDTPFDRQIAPATPWRRLTVQGGSTLHLSPFGRPLQALVAWPAEDRPAAEIGLLLIDAQREAWWTRHVAGADLAHPPRNPAEPGPLTVTATTPSGGPAPAAMRLARGDRTSLLLTLGGGDGCVQATVGGAMPPGVDVKLRYVTWLDAAGHPDRIRRPRPVVLGDDPQAGCGQGVPPVVLLTVRTHDDSPAGTWPLTVHLRRDDEDLTHPLSVVVEDVSLAPAMPMGLFAQVAPVVTLREGVASPAVRHALDRQLQVLSEAGLDALSLRYTLWPRQGPTGDEVDTRLLDHATASWHALGGRTFIWADAKVSLRPFAYAARGPVLPRRMQAPARAMLTATDAQPLPVWLHMWEEEAGWKRLEAVPRGRRFATELRALVDQPPPLVATLATPADWAVADAFDIVMVTGPGDALVQGVATTRDRASQVWAYNLAVGASGPLQAWAADVDGFLQWHSDPFVQDPFHDVHRKPRWFHTVLGTDGDVHGTVQLEELAEGVALVRLLSTLQQRLHQLRRRDAQQAAAWLSATQQAFLAAHPSPAWDGGLVAPSTFTTLRNTTLDALKRVPK